MNYSYCKENRTHNLLLPCPVLEKKVRVGLKILRRSKAGQEIGLFGECAFKEGTECRHPKRWTPKCIVMLCFAESVAEVIRDARAEAGREGKRVSRNGC